MQLEGVIVCKDYSDFLEHSLPENLAHFDRLVVVTHPDDKQTQALCQKYSVEVVQTVCMHENGDAFNKGRAINLGLGHLRGLEWILHLDADIVLPHNFRQMLQRAQMRTDCIYGADRVNVFGHDKWMAHQPKRKPYYSSGYFVEPPSDFPMGARIIHHEHGYTPIGYFQLWHEKMGKRYPTNQGNAEHTDVLFSCQWARFQRVLLPEVVVYHLDSLDGPSPMGANWGGRKTPIFGPKKHQGGNHCGGEKHHEHHHHKHHHCHPKPYKPC